MRAIADNDILLKAACYGLQHTLVSTVPGNGGVGILGASKFVVPKKIAQLRLRGEPSAAQARFLNFLAQNVVLEPSSDERELAALFEASAQRMALNLDTGESQLVAIFISRSVPWLLTGDKRAIAAIEMLFDTDKRLAVIAGKIKCLEQLIRDLLALAEVEEIRSTICAEPSVDRSLSVCFSCSNPAATSSTVMEGLASYISDLRLNAGRVLAT